MKRFIPFILLLLAASAQAQTFSGTVEICGSGIDENSGESSPCPAGYAEAAVGSGCDLLCTGKQDADRDGYPASQDCDDEDRTVFPGHQKSCGTDGTQTCQTSGSYSSCVEGDLCEATGSGVCYYISTSGNNANDCTSRSTPCADLGNFSFGTTTGNSTPLNAGDVVYLAEGTYTTDYTYSSVDRMVYIRLRDGTASEPIIIKPYPGAWGSVILDPSQTANGFGIAIEDSDYVHVYGLKITGSYAAAIKVSGNSTGNIIEGNIIYGNDGLEDNNGTGLEWNASDSGEIARNIFYDNYDTGDNGTNNSNVIFYKGTGISFHHNVSAFTDTARAFATNSQGFKYKHSDESVSSTFDMYENIIMGAGRYGIEVSQAGSNIHDNLIMDAGTGAFRLADVGGPFYPVNIVFDNNTIINSRGPSLRFNSADVAVSSVTISDNIFLDDEATAYNNDTRMFNLNHYGTDALFTEVITGGQMSITGNCYYNASQSFSGSVYGSRPAGSVYSSFSTWQAAGYDTAGSEESPSLDANNEPSSANCLSKGWILSALSVGGRKTGTSSGTTNLGVILGGF